ncbi:MAG TPA: hypothetical protein DF712_09500 [Balneola sp.]|jgi:hypothetical protein|nr:hypothetical protein [Bacteroidota bacterium]MAO77221.1 hypothetical protein [Balneola sp.]MAB65982.1 hypothetical protein [Bacteroidota bacterium]MBF65959.1 hypothetical protein [Balneola sp.]MBF66056.1 hypothetical protein [Balneola sp.]|tara:strand:+ start:7264 stop:7560 length:297 start_codon:yes stop_codon:yes gene_type:complete
MYQDLADAVESMKEKGFTHTYTISENVITCEELETEFDVDNLKIVDSYSHDSGTDPGSESTVYCIESNEGVKGTLVIGFGMYSDPNKAKLIDRLLKNT